MFIRSASIFFYSISLIVSQRTNYSCLFHYNEITKKKLFSRRKTCNNTLKKIFLFVPEQIRHLFNLPIAIVHTKKKKFVFFRFQMFSRNVLLNFLHVTKRFNEKLNCLFGLYTLFLNTANVEHFFLILASTRNNETFNYLFVMDWPITF